MGFRFRKSVKLGKGINLNLSKSGIGISAGIKELRVSTGPRGTRVSTNIPGTGISHRAELGRGTKQRIREPMQEIQVPKNASIGLRDSELDRLPQSGWNWWAFLFGGLWYLYKGMLGKGLLIIVAGTIGSIFTFGLVGLVLWIYCGAKGNEDHYLHRKKVVTELAA